MTNTLSLWEISWENECYRQVEGSIFFQMAKTQVSIYLPISTNTFVIAKLIYLTLQKTEVYGWWNDPANHFIICHILYIWKPKVAFSIFQIVLLYFFLNECPGLCWYRPGHSLGEKITYLTRNGKWKKQLWGFIYNIHI